MADQTDRFNLDTYSDGDENWSHTDTVELLDELGVERGPISSRPATGTYDDEFYFATDQQILWRWDANASDWVAGLGADGDPVPATSYFEQLQSTLHKQAYQIDEDLTVPDGYGTVVAGPLEGSGSISGNGRVAVVQEGHQFTDNVDAQGNDINNAGTVDSDSVKTEQAAINQFAVDLEKTSDQSISANTDTTIDWDSQDVDTGLYTYNATQDTIDVSEGGDYRVTGSLRVDGVSDQDLFQIRLFINGNREKTPDYRSSGTVVSGSFSALLKDLSAGDTIRIDIRVGSGGTLVGNNSTYASISKEA
jgi:hypothetical protein